MVWSVVLYIAAGLLGVLLLSLIFLLFSPLYLKAHFIWQHDSQVAVARFWLIHPFIFTIKYDIVKNDLLIKLLGWKIRKKKSEEQSLEEKNVEEPVTTVQVAEQVSAQEEVKAETVELSDAEIEPEIKLSVPESVEKKTAKIDNIIGQIKNSKLLFIASEKRWLKKMGAWFLCFLKSFFYLIRCNYAKAYLKAGIEDPALLGRIYGYYVAVRNGLSTIDSRFDVLFEPVFMENHFEGNGEIEIKSSMGRLLAPVGFAIFTFPYISTLFVYIRYRRRYKKAGKTQKND